MLKNVLALYTLLKKNVDGVFSKQIYTMEIYFFV